MKTCRKCGQVKSAEDFYTITERIRNTDLQMRYGITLADFRAMYARQEGRCAICGAADEKLVVDHHHDTGRVRALLCHLCNTMLGCAREREDILARSIAYLRAATASTLRPQP